MDIQRRLAQQAIKIWSVKELIDPQFTVSDGITELLGDLDEEREKLIIRVRTFTRLSQELDQIGEDEFKRRYSENS